MLVLILFQSVNNNETKNNCHVILLLQCVRCGEPEAKELKKAPNSFLLEMKSSYAPARKKNKKDLQKVSDQIALPIHEESKS